MPVSNAEPQTMKAEAASFDTGSRIRVDINKNDGRKASYSKNANNWLLKEGSSDTYNVNGVTFKLSNGGSVGGNVCGANNKKLQLQSGIYPRLIMDGAKIKDGDSGGVLKLEISGLSNENHSLRMWHCNVDGYANSKLSIAVNGKKVLSGVNCPTNVTDENNAGISYVTWSGSSVTMGGMGLGSCNNSIVDHCSISWATDEGFSSRSAANITFQWNIIGESLHDSVHYDAGDRDKSETHAFAASIGGYTGSFHHNLLINNTGRNWSLAGAMEQDAVTYGGQLDIRNNVVYNWRDRTTDGGARRVQFVNNYYKAGAVSNTDLHLVSVDGNELNTSDMQMLYASGNMKVAQNGKTMIGANEDEWKSGKAKSGGKNSTNETIRSDKPWFESYVNTQSAEDAYKDVIVKAGANEPKFDYIDSRYQNEVKDGTYTYTGSKQNLKGIIDSQNDVGGYPNNSNFKGGAAPTDTDRDGMADDWEKAHGLNPNNANDGAMISLSADDYTNLEMYLNELAGDAVDYNGNIKREPITGSLISSVEVLDTAYYDSWAIDTSIGAGDVLFGDRTADRCAVSELPDELKGAELVLTPCDAKASSKNQAIVTAAKDITIFVGLDSRVTNVPDWLSGFAKTNAVIKTTNDITFELYSYSLKSGDTFTLGANGQSSGCMNYIVLASDSAGSDISSEIIGDVNMDGKFDLTDVVLVQKWLLAVPNTTLVNWKAGDLCKDDKLDVFDLYLMKRELVNRNSDVER